MEPHCYFLFIHALYIYIFYAAYSKILTSRIYFQMSILGNILDASDMLYIQHQNQNLKSVATSQHFNLA